MCCLQYTYNNVNILFKINPNERTNLDKSSPSKIAWIYKEKLEQQLHINQKLRSLSQTLQNFLAMLTLSSKIAPSYCKPAPKKLNFTFPKFLQQVISRKMLTNGHSYRNFSSNIHKNLFWQTSTCFLEQSTCFRLKYKIRLVKKQEVEENFRNRSTVFWTLLLLWLYSL